MKKNFIILFFLVSACKENINDGKKEYQSIKNERKRQILLDSLISDTIEVDSYTQTFAKFQYSKNIIVSRIQNVLCFSNIEIDEDNFWSSDIYMFIRFNWCDDTLSDESCLKSLIKHNNLAFSLNCKRSLKEYKTNYMNFKMLECMNKNDEKVIQFFDLSTRRFLINEIVILKHNEEMLNIVDSYQYHIGLRNKAFEK